MWAVRVVFASKKKREAFRKVAGYALMEPVGKS
jgi:hypothetical protein